jgi:hypothetical protein
MVHLSEKQSRRKGGTTLKIGVRGCFCFPGGLQAPLGSCYGRTQRPGRQGAEPSLGTNRASPLRCW